jgi:hypothetical protein
MSRKNSRHLREQRREDAIARQQVYDKLSAQQRLDLIDTRLGKGIGATRERARLAIILQPAEEPTAKDDLDKKPPKKREARKRRNKKRGNR